MARPSSVRIRPRLSKAAFRAVSITGQSAAASTAWPEASSITPGRGKSASNDGSTRLHLPLAAEINELLPVALQHVNVDAVVVGRAAAIDADVDLDGSAMNGLAHHRLDQRVERGVALAGANGQLEEAVVDRADFDRHGQAVLLTMRLAEAGHALQQGGQLRVSGQWLVVSG